MPYKDKEKRKIYHKIYSDKYYNENHEKKLADHKKWRDNNKEKIKAKRILNKLYQKNYMLMRLYGITLEQYNKMFNDQNGCCAICNRHATEFKYGLVVDHDHITAKIRGLLCGKCNTALGLINNKDILTKMLEYLDKNYVQQY